MEEPKAALVAELDALDEQIKALEKALKVKPNYGMGVGDPAVTQWELDQALLERLQAHAHGLRRAITRYDSGGYGICERCGKPINPERLEVLPDTTLCIECAQKRH